MPSNLETAVALHQQGRLDQAARLYHGVLAEEPDNVDALHLLGVIALQQGNPAQAVERIARAVALRPNVAAFHCNLAEAYRAQGQFDRAVGCCRTALRLDPSYAEAANNLGLALQAQRRLHEAAAQFRAAFTLNPAYAMAHSNLGVVLREQGDSAGAKEEFEEAARLMPTLAEAHNNLAQLCVELRDLAAAERHGREAVRLRHDFAEAHNNLGHVLRQLKQHTEAKAAFAEALRLQPSMAMASSNLGLVLQDEGKFDDALVWFEQAAQLQPDIALFQANLGGIHEDLENYPEAVRRYQTAVRLAPERADLHNRLGFALQEEARHAEALVQYLDALRLQPDLAQAHVNLGDLFSELGRLPEAEASLRTALTHNPKHAGAMAQLSTMLRGKLPQADQDRMVELLADPELAEEARPRLHFGLAHVLDAKGEYAQAAEHLRLANAAALAERNKIGKGYEPDQHRLFVDNLCAHFTPELFARLAGFGSTSERPVFIVGLPRSGTTLLEQVLASHSRIHGAGERRFCRMMFDAIPEVTSPRRSGNNRPTRDQNIFESFPRLDRPAVEELARRHLALLTGVNDRAARVVDKMPDDYLHLGLIAILFPKARVIHCRRDLRDVAVSCWMTNFRQIRWANDMGHIASRFQEYRRIMAHWQKALPLAVLEIDYEATVTDLESVARRLLDWCGVEWEPACLAFHENKRPVRTASVMQVRQPLYQGSVARWKNYEGSLRELFAALS